MSKKNGRKKSKIVWELLVGAVILGILFWFQFYDRTAINSVGGTLADYPILLIVGVVVFSIFILFSGVRSFREKSYIEAQWEILAGIVGIIGVLLVIFW